MTIKVCLAGAAGWAGSELARGIAHTTDLSLIAGVSRTQAGQTIADVLKEPRLTGWFYATAAEALHRPCDVFVEYTKPTSAKTNIITALEHGAHVVVGTSGLTDQDYDEIDAVAQKHQRGVLACGNFALTAVLMQRFAEEAARLIPQWEIIEYASDAKVDVPSGTVRELVTRLGNVTPHDTTIPVDKVIGPKEARGANMAGTQVHAVRLPGHVLGVEVQFGMPDQTLSIKHNSGSSARPYVDGAILAIRKVHTLVGVHRGLDKVLIPS